MPLLHFSNAKLEILRHCSQCCNACNSIFLRYLPLHRTTGNSFYIELLHDNEQNTDRIPTITPPAQNLEKYVGISVRFSML